MTPDKAIDLYLDLKTKRHIARTKAAKKVLDDADMTYTTYKELEAAITDKLPEKSEINGCTVQVIEKTSFVTKKEHRINPRKFKQIIVHQTF